MVGCDGVGHHTEFRHYVANHTGTGLGVGVYLATLIRVKRPGLGQHGSRHPQHANIHEERSDDRDDWLGGPFIVLRGDTSHHLGHGQGMGRDESGRGGNARPAGIGTSRERIDVKESQRSGPAGLVEERSGVILKISGTTVVVRNDLNEIRKYTGIPAGATVYFDGEPIKFRDLREGMHYTAVRFEGAIPAGDVSMSEVEAMPSMPPDGGR